jgi:hypothetical protein
MLGDLVIDTSQNGFGQSEAERPDEKLGYSQLSCVFCHNDFNRKTREIQVVISVLN